MNIRITDEILFRCTDESITVVSEFDHLNLVLFTELPVLLSDYSPLHIPFDGVIEM